jgi:membrane protein
VTFQVKPAVFPGVDLRINRRSPFEDVLPKSGSGAKRPAFLSSLAVVAAGLAFSALKNAKPPPPRSQPPNPEAPPSGLEPPSRQLVRAQEHGRGRRAVSPLQISWQGWKDILWRIVSRISKNRVLAMSAAVVFYGLLALFPAVTALVSSYGLFTGSATIRDHLSFVSEFLPADAYSIIQDQVNRVVSKGDAKLSLAFLFGLGLALWSANSGTKAIIDALNAVYEEDEKRSFIRLNLVSLAFTVSGIAAVLVAVGAVVVTPLILTRLGLAAMTESIVRIVRWPVMMMGMLAALAVLYRFGPSRRKAKWKWLSVGAVVATAAWFAGSAVLSYYLANFANYDAVYGSLGAGIGTMIWMWMSATTILLGAQINSEIEHQTARDTTVGHEKPLGARGAVMADTVGEARTP